MSNVHRIGAAAGLVLALLTASLVGVAQAATAAVGPSISSVSSTSGPTAGGTRILIKGTGFRHVIAVRFGARSAPRVRVVSPRRIQVTAPPHAAGTFNIRVLTSAGASQRGPADRFTYVAPPTITAVAPAKGATAGGARITITGTHFIRVTGVRLDGKAATSVHVLSPFKIQVTAPPHTAGTVPLTVSTAFGVSPAVLAHRFTYVSPPQVTGVSPLTGTTLGGITTQLVGSGFSETTAVSFGDAPATEVTVQDDSHLSVVSPAHQAGSVDVRVTTPYGRSSVTTAGQFTYVAPPQVTGVSATTGPTAGGATIALTGTGFAGVDTVLFGDTAATDVDVQDDTHLTATAPARPAGTVDVRVSNAYGMSSASTADHYRYELTWEPGTVIDPIHGNASGLSCATETFCLGVDRHGYAFTFDGTTWSPVTKVHDNALLDVSCATPTFCAATDDAGNVIDYDGAAWSAGTHVDDRALIRLTCLKTHFCAAVDDGGNVSTYDGSSWSATANVDEAPLTGISCVSETFCMAVDRAGNELTFNGTSWTDPTSIYDDALADVSCVSETECVAVGTKSALFRFDGAGWHQEAPFDDRSGSGYYDLTKVRCAGPQFCSVVDENSQIYTFAGSDSYNHWIPTGSTPGLNDGGISCLSDTFCVGIGDWGLAGDFRGMHARPNGSLPWTQSFFADYRNTMTDVSCPSASFCVAVDVGGYAVTFDGSTWTSPERVDDQGFLEGVSCTSRSFCAAVDNWGNAITFDGTAWTEPTPGDGLHSPPLFNSWYSVSCSSATFCVAVGRKQSWFSQDIAAASVFDGSSWSPLTSLPVGQYARDVSCASPSFCLVVGSDGTLTTYDGSVWKASSAVDGMSTIGRVACASAPFCIAIGDGGKAATFNGSTWDPPVPLEGVGSISGLSCTSRSFCVAVGQDGTLSTFDGTTWTLGTKLDSTYYVAGVSCVSSSFCVAIDSNGRAFLAR